MTATLGKEEEESISQKKKYSHNEWKKEFFKSFDFFLTKGKSLSQVFDDFLTITICVFSNERMEDLYLQTISGYSREELEQFPKMIGMLRMSIQLTGEDILGEYFEENISHGRNGQFFTPEGVADLMAMFVVGDDLEEKKVLAKAEGRLLTVDDPTCGSGRNFLAVSRIEPDCFFHGVDIDHRCAKMAVINLMLNGLRGIIVCGDSLCVKQRAVYLIGFDGVGLVKTLDHEARNYILPQWMVERSKQKHDSPPPEIIPEEKETEPKTLKKNTQKPERRETFPEEEKSSEEIFDSFGNSSPYDNSPSQESEACATEKLDQLAF